MEQKVTNGCNKANMMMTYEKWVILVYGYPGAGKSVIAQNISRYFQNPVVLSNDILRKQLGYPMSGKKYTEKVYIHAVSQACSMLERGYTIILDATFYSKHYRSILFDSLKALQPCYILINVKTPIHICKNRVLFRQKTGIGIGQDNVKRFNLLLNKTEKWEPQEFPDNYFCVDIDCSNRKPQILSYSDSLPKEILVKINLLCEEKQDEIQ